MNTIFRLVLLCGVFAVPTAFAESAWVSDEFEVTLRSGPSTGNAIQLMVGSGTRLEVLERDADCLLYTSDAADEGVEG